MQVHENLNMDTPTAYSHSPMKWKKNLKYIIVIACIFLFSLVATGLIVYNFATCPEIPVNAPICNSHYSSDDYPSMTSESNQSKNSNNNNNNKNINSQSAHNNEIDNELTTSSSASSSSPSSSITNHPSSVTTSSLSTTATTTASTSKYEHDKDVRLPRSIRPQFYDVKLIPYFAEKNFTFDGDVRIVIEILEDTNNITMHAATLLIRDENVEVNLLDSNETSVVLENEHIENISFVERKQFLIIHFDKILPKESFYEVKIKYTGLLNDYLQGFYRSSYKKGNETRWLATTQFQPTDARRAFPCFDEPSYKAKFNISIARPKDMTSISNMPKLGKSLPVDGIPNYEWDIYEESLPMSTYLVAFVVSDFVTERSGNFGVWSRANAIKSAKYALDIGPKILEFLEKFFGIDYPLPKTDMIALPDFSAGAMENWGLITYRETSMLYDEGISAHSHKQRVATTVCHELAHQWFGNLVTPSWWSDLWLNEGFASYMEFVGVDAIEPSWKIMDQFVVDKLQNVFSLDALSSSHQISVEVGNPDEIDEIFDRISYEKGATIIRMMDHFLTTEIFKRGLTNYLRNMAYQSAEQDDLWNYLTEEARYANIFDSNTSVKEIMDTWTLQTGYPVINVTRNYETHSVKFTQERFMLIESPQMNLVKKEDPLWWVPITYTTLGKMNFDNTRPTHWMKATKELVIDDLQIPNFNWMIVNIQQTGYYRVNYDQNNWDMIVAHLRQPKNYENIATSNRAQLIDDALNLARGGQLSYNTALDVTRYLAHETSYVPWKAAINALNYIDSMLMKGPDYYKFKVYFLDLLDKVYNLVGFEDAKNDDILTILKRFDVLSAACHLGYKDCIFKSVSKFHAWMNQPEPDKYNPISPNLKNIVYCTAIKYGSDAEWDFAWDRYHKTTIPSEKETILSALGCSRELWILSRYLERAMNDTYGIRKQDVFRVFIAVSQNVLGQPIAFNFIRDNWQRMREYMGQSMSNMNTILKYTTIRLNNQYELDELKRFAKTHLKESGRTIQQAIERAEANIDWKNKNYGTIVNWLGKAIQSR